MAITLEAVITIPITIFITVGLIAISADLYENVRCVSRVETDSMITPLNNKDLWKIQDTRSSENVHLSYSVSVNPVKEKMFIDFIFDTATEISEVFPAIMNLEGIAFNG